MIKYLNPKSHSMHEMRLAMQDDDSELLVQILDELMGSYAVAYTLQILTRRDNMHTILSLQSLLEKGRSKRTVVDSLLPIATYAVNEFRNR